jgi:hypothetical protein
MSTLDVRAGRTGEGNGARSTGADASPSLLSITIVSVVIAILISETTSGLA